MTSADELEALARALCLIEGIDPDAVVDSLVGRLNQHGTGTASAPDASLRRPAPRTGRINDGDVAQFLAAWLHLTIFMYAGLWTAGLAFLVFLALSVNAVDGNGDKCSGYVS
jgi:hypothetical protein